MMTREKTNMDDWCTKKHSMGSNGFHRNTVQEFVCSLQIRLAPFELILNSYQLNSGTQFIKKKKMI